MKTPHYHVLQFGQHHPNWWKNFMREMYKNFRDHESQFLSGTHFKNAWFEHLRLELHDWHAMPTWCGNSLMLEFRNESDFTLFVLSWS